MTAPALAPVPVLVRPARGDDQAFVMSTWSAYLCEHGDVCERPHPRYSKNGRMVGCQAARTVADRLVDSKLVRVVVAANPVMSSHLFGWLAFTDSGAARIVHGVYVRSKLRDRGIARQMLEGANIADARPLMYTVKGPAAKSLLNKPANQTAIELSLEEFLR